MEQTIFPGYVLFEGLDFTGKSTIAPKLVERLNNNGPLSVQYRKGFFHRNDLEEVEFLAAKLNSKDKEMYFKGLYVLDKSSRILTHELVIQDRYFPSIIFYGRIVNGSRSFSSAEIDNNFILPKHVFLFECSYESKVKRARGRGRYPILEKLVLESEANNKKMEMLYREIIQETGISFTLVNTSDRSIDKTVDECYDRLTHSDILLEEVLIDNLFVDWEPRIHPSTAKNYAKLLDSGGDTKPLLISRLFNLDRNFVRDLVVDGRHRAYAHRLSKRKTAKAFVQRVLVDEPPGSVKLIPIAEWGFK